MSVKVKLSEGKFPRHLQERGGGFSVKARKERLVRNPSHFNKGGFFPTPYVMLSTRYTRFQRP